MECVLWTMCACGTTNEEKGMSCGLCGSEDDTVKQFGKWWSPDDGWRFAPLCAYCWGQVKDDKPKTGDYAVYRQEEYGEAAFEDDAEYGSMI